MRVLLKSDRVVSDYCFVPSAYCFVPSASCLSEPFMLLRRARFAFDAIRGRIEEVLVKLNQRFDGNAVNMIWRRSEAHDRAATDDGSTEATHQFDGFFYSVAAANNVVDNNAGIDLTPINVLPEHPLAAFLFGPINLLGTERVAHREGDRNAAGAGTDDGNFR